MLHKNVLKFIMFSVVKVQCFFEICKRLGQDLGIRKLRNCLENGAMCLWKFAKKTNEVVRRHNLNVICK